MTKAAVLTFSDDREFVHHSIADFVAEAEGRVAAGSWAAGQEVVLGSEPITPSDTALAEARRGCAAHPHLTTSNYPVWAFPHFSVHAARAATGPLLRFSNIDPAYPGVVDTLAAGGSLDQLGRQRDRLWGQAESPSVNARLNALTRAAHRVHLLDIDLETLDVST